MEERRRAKRMPITLSLDVSNLYHQNMDLVKNINAHIEVVDISKEGLGFISESELPIGYYFNANISLNNEDTLHSVVKIIRRQPLEGNMRTYGCEFVGISTVLSYIFDEYNKKLSD
ncbi:MAG: PilZ domain-containing protein [Clostridiales bacterium]|nr:PilZ domain-containing protein [Clostridiales bacterium]